MTAVRTTWIVALLSWLPLAASNGLAQAPNRLAARIDSVFAVYQRPGTPGCAVGVSKAGALEYAKGYGLANVESTTPITPATVFNVGSTSKQFVAFAIALLAAEGKLSLADPVRRFVPEVPDFGTPVTIRQLLNHTSGLRDYASVLSLMGWQGGDQYDEGRFLSLIGGQRRLNFTPGTRHLYSNTGYILLATIVSRASGKGWPAFAAERIFRPLQMTKSEVRTDPFALAPDRALAYSPAAGGTWRLDMPNHDIAGSTAVMTTVEDLARWTGNYWRPVVGDEAVLATMLQRGVLAGGDTIAYAAGLMIGEYRGLALVDHGGATGGYRAQLLRFPTEQVGIAVLCNAGNSNPDGLARQVADRVLESRLRPARPAAPAVTLSSADLRVSNRRAIGVRFDRVPE
ncbi:MAG: serine hydrolase domain-containing protein [Gemmatimonadota bacterium]